MFRFRLTAVCLVFICCDMAVSADEVLYGSIEGRVIYRGEHSELEPLFRAGDEVKDAEVCASNDLPDERLVVDTESRGVSNVLVWLKRRKDAPVHPDLTKQPLNIPELTFQGCRIRPHVLCAQTQTGMKVVSKDAVTHGPHDYPLRNPVGCVLLAPGLPGKKEFSNIHNFHVAEPLPMKITCDFHPWIMGYVLVQDHPYMAVTDKQGRFRIEKVPCGEIKVQIWHELAGYLRRDQTIELNLPEKKIEDTELKIDEKTSASLRFVRK
ncbi:MAG: hypothetical protein JNM43_02415 [Planctomycetaceae bacterium]|nr:hypothetical protein [Planctomycetaceae bacterium]